MSAQDFDNDEITNTKMKAAFKLTETKLAQYYAPEECTLPSRRKRFTQHALPLLKAVRTFDPSRALFVYSAIKDLHSIPGFGKTEATEFQIFLQQCSEMNQHTETIQYWRLVSSRLPALS